MWSYLIGDLRVERASLKGARERVPLVRSGNEVRLEVTRRAMQKKGMEHQRPERHHEKWPVQVSPLWVSPRDDACRARHKRSLESSRLAAYVGMAEVGMG